MDIEVSNHKIKVDAPRVHLYIDGPFINGFSEKEDAQNKELLALHDDFNAKLEVIFGAPAEDSWAGKYYWPEWMDREARLAFALALERFKEDLRYQAAIAYGLYVDRQRDKKEKETKNDAT